MAARAGMILLRFRWQKHPRTDGLMDVLGAVQLSSS